VRVTTAFNKLLRLPGASVVGVTFGAEGVVVAVRLRRRRSRCSGCGRKAPIHDRSTRRWRHLDLGAQRCLLEGEIRRVRCPECGVKVEEVPFARPGVRHTRDFEDLTAFLAQQASKTVIARLLRIDWATVGRIVERVVEGHLDETRLAGLVMIGVDEVSWRKRHRYLTCVADHIDGGVVWVAEGRSAATLQGFFEELGGDAATIQAVSIDMSAGYEKAVREAIPHAQIAFDPFHVSFVIDVFSRKVVGWQLATNMRTDLVLDALRMARGLRSPGADVALVHHSDRSSMDHPESHGLRGTRDGPFRMRTRIAIYPPCPSKALRASPDQRASPC